WACQSSGPGKSPGHHSRRDAASVTSESCAWRRHNRAETRNGAYFH
ncbi:unnamed protein product, partial [Brassica oleracea var. botrytis]